MVLAKLKTALEKEGLIAAIRDNMVEACRDWSYKSGANVNTDWYNPADAWIEEYSENIYITFNGAAFIAVDEVGKQVAMASFDYGEEYSFEENAEIAAGCIADDIATLLPERDIAAENTQAYWESLIDAGEYL